MRARDLTIAILLALFGAQGLAAEDFVVVTAMGVTEPETPDPGTVLAAGSELALEPWGRVVLRETGGCGLTHVVVGQDRHPLEPAEDCADVGDAMSLAARIQSGERLVGRVDEEGEGRGRDLVVFLAQNPCAFFPPVSEEESRNTRECPSGYALRGVRCSGQFCDDKNLLCCPYLEGAPDPSAKIGVALAISEEFPTSMATKKYLAGLSCTGSYCDDVQPHTLKTERLAAAKGCDWTRWSSEQPGAWLDCGPGKLANGIRCQGDYCADVALSCCDVRPQ